MKKALTVTLVLLLALSFCACTLRKDHVLITGFGDGGDDYLGEVSVEYDLLRSTKQVGDKNRTYEASIEGIVCTGVYDHTVFVPYYKCDTDFYTCSDDSGLEIQFGVNRASDKLVLYNLSYTDGYVIQSDDKTYEECYQIALSELGRHLNASDYVPHNLGEITKPLHDTNRGNVYTYFFKKASDEFKTNILVTIMVNSDGWVCYYCAMEDPSLDLSKDHSAAVEAMNSERTLELLDAKIRSIYSKCDQDKLTWDIKNKFISKLRSGKECVQFEIHVYPEGGEGKSFITLLLPV